jgi:hypothetical protein
MTTVDTSPGLRRRLSRLWRQRLIPDSTAPQPAAATPSPCSPEEAPVGHVYPSSNAEPGQVTTALGRHHTAEHLLVTPREIPGDRTQVIRVNPVPAAPAQAAVIALDPATEVSLGADILAADPPIYLRTLAEVERLRALPPAATEERTGDAVLLPIIPLLPAKEGDIDDH